MYLKQLKPEDLNLIVDGAREFAAEAELPGFNDAVFVDTFSSLLRVNVAHVIAAFSDDGIAQGAIGFSVYANPFSGEKSATEMFWFVRKPYRGGTLAIRLFKEFERLAANMGCKALSMVYLYKLQSDRLQIIYKKLGYSPVEACYTKRLQS